MKTRLFISTLFLFILLVVAGQASGMDMGNDDNLDGPVVGDRFLMLADNFYIFYDASYGMDEPYKDTGLTRMEAEKQIISKFDALPDLGWQAGLYPQWKGGLWLHGTVKSFNPFYELKRYEQVSYGEAIERLPVKPTGPPMLQRGLMKLGHLLALLGRTQVFIFSDGQHSTAKELETEPLEQAKIITQKYDVCLTIISSATTPEGTKLLNDIAALNKCSKVIDFDTVYENQDQLFDKLYVHTDDLNFKNILFDFDKYNIRPEYKTILNRLGRFLRDNPHVNVLLSGFCDSRGTEAFNMKLSRNRAERVRDYLSQNFNIPYNRLLTYWYGYKYPVASNDTEQGRARNRRVTIGFSRSK